MHDPYRDLSRRRRGGRQRRAALAVARRAPVVPLALAAAVVHGAAARARRQRRVRARGRIQRRAPEARVALPRARRRVAGGGGGESRVLGVPRCAARRAREAEPKRRRPERVVVEPGLAVRRGHHARVHERVVAAGGRRVAVLMLRSRSAESERILPPSVTIMTRASVDCSWSRTYPAMYADARAERPAKPVSSVTASRRLALPLSCFAGFAFTIGFYFAGDCSDFLFGASLECFEQKI